ncbi:MAG TPA: L,D-transpeptidase [Candidatus Polarisedimenticolaceae bacterium]|nr:L,D-transpeptidase [Candidatus Polarisedimenticolaceae bacterium]
MTLTLRQGLRALVLVAALAASVAVAYPVFSGRTDPAPRRLAAARAALASAAAGGAREWAPQAWTAASRALQQAQVEHRRQELRFLPLKDFRAARKAAERAWEAAEAAEAAAAAARAGARGQSMTAMNEAEEELDTAEAFAAAMHLRAMERRRLQSARTSLTEARLYHARGDYLAAAQSGRRAAAEARAISGHAAVAASRLQDAGLVRRWGRWIGETVAWSRRTGQPAIVVHKADHRLTLYGGGRPVKTYRADMGFNLVGDKTVSGDGATPEGRYRITAKKGRGSSIYHMALLLDYPNAEDRAEFARMKKRGQVPRRAGIGGLIEIHGEGGRGKDWTKGCVALSNRDIEDLFRRVSVGTPVTIVGTDGSAGSLGTLLVRQQQAASVGAGAR